MTIHTGKQYLPDPGFETGWSDPSDGGSRGWGIPPVVGYNADDFGGVDRPTFLQPDGPGSGYMTLQTEPLFESWQRTPGHVLHIETDANGGDASRSFWVPVVPGRKYVVRYGKKILNASGLHPAFFIRILWAKTIHGLSFADTQIGKDDIDPGVYTYEQVVTPPTIDAGWTADASWARVMIYPLGQGGPDGYVDALIDDVEFSALNQPPVETGPDTPVDPGSIETTVGLDLYQAMEPLTFAEERLGYPLLAFADAIGGMFQPLLDIVDDPNILLDPDRALVGWLPWLGQFVGQQLKGDQLPTESNEAYRARVAPLIKNPPHRRRGTVPSIVDEVRSFLNPPGDIYTVERQGGNMYIGAIGVVTAQIKSGFAVADIQARVNEIEPGGRIITVSGISGATWQALRDTHTDWSDVQSTFTDWAEVKSNPTKT